MIPHPGANVPDQPTRARAVQITSPNQQSPPQKGILLLNTRQHMVPAHGLGTEGAQPQLGLPCPFPALDYRGSLMPVSTTGYCSEPGFPWEQSGWLTSRRVVLHIQTPKVGKMNLNAHGQADTGRAERAWQGLVSSGKALRNKCYAKSICSAPAHFANSLAHLLIFYFLSGKIY